MKTRIAITATLALTTAASHAARFSTAEITRAINDVRLLLASGGSRSASIGSTVARETSVLTGKKSRAELTFPDDSIVRLGQNTSFSFLGGRREVNLEQGTILLQQPKWRGRTEIRTAAVSAAITGTTVIIESSPLKRAAGRGVEQVASAEAYAGAKAGLAPWDDGAKGGMAPPVDPGDGIVKLLVLEGSLKFNLNTAPNKSMTLGPGEMVALRANATELPRKLVFDVAQLQKTSGLLGGDFARLPHADRIQEQAVAQAGRKRDAKLLEVNLAQLPAKRTFPLRLFPRTEVVQDVRNRAPQPPPPMTRIFRRPEPPVRRSAPPVIPMEPMEPMEPENPNTNPPTTGGNDNPPELG